MRRFGGRPDLTRAQQFALLRSSALCPGHGSLTATNLMWKFEAQPTPISRSYQIRVDYDGRLPDVFVEAPDLLSVTGGRTPPHVYHDPLRLCLFVPGSGQWDRTTRLDTTIVPWVNTWLFYFEDWLADGVWQGGGVHPGEEGELSRGLRRLIASSERNSRRRFVG